MFDCCYCINSKKYLLFERGAGKVGFRSKKKQYVFTFGALYKISSSYPRWSSSFNTNKRSKWTGKSNNSANVLQISVKSHLNIDPKQYSEFQDPSLSNSLDIVLTRFSYC